MYSCRKTFDPSISSASPRRVNHQITEPDIRQDITPSSPQPNLECHGFCRGASALQDHMFSLQGMAALEAWPSSDIYIYILTAIKCLCYFLRRARAGVERKTKPKPAVQVKHVLYPAHSHDLGKASWRMLRLCRHSKQAAVKSSLNS